MLQDRVMKSKRLIIIGLALIVIETLIFGLWIYSEKPTPDVSIALVIIVPFLFGVSIILGLVFYLLKRRPIANLIFLNSVIAPTIFYFLWTLWFMGWRDRNYTEYSFVIDKAEFEVSLSKTNDYFSISDITNQQNGSTTGLFFGQYQVIGDTIVMEDGQTRMKIAGDKLFGFPQSSTEIKLCKVTKR
jgi:hypothetical protein